MSDICPTVIIETKNGPVTINMSDFDPAKHKLAVGDALPPMEPLLAPIEPALPEAEVYSVGKNGKRGGASKYVIYNSKNQIAFEDEFETLDEAQAAVDDLNNKDVA